MPCTKDIVRLMFGADAVKKLSSLSLFDNTVQRRIEEMSKDIMNQVMEKIKQSPFYVLQLDSQQMFLLVLSLWYMYVISTIVISKRSCSSVGH